MPSYYAHLLKAIKTRKAKIAIVGLGYVGLPLAVEFAKKGFAVLGFDADKDRVENLRRKHSYITDISSKEVAALVSRGKLIPSSDPHTLRQADVLLICVPTPLKRKYDPDISFIKSAVKSIVNNLKKGALVILESTTYPGTTEEVILPMFKSRGLAHGRDFYLCFSPERIDPGNANFPVNKIAKVVGGVSPEASKLAQELYKTAINKVVPVSSTRVAETVKLLENTFRIVNIGLIDEIAMMANKMGLDIWEIVDAAKTKPFGFMAFYPGPGVGGHCIPKDPLYLYWKARHYGFKSRFIKLASDVISHMPVYVVERVSSILIKKGIRLKEAKVLVIGATYKKDVKDLRKSPALDIIEELKRRHSSVEYHDPLIPYLKIGGINLRSVPLTKKELSRFDCVVIATDHSKVDYKLLSRSSKLIFDTRNIYKRNSPKLFRL